MANTMVRIRRKWGGQAGFTLAEMMVAVAISSIIVIGSLMFLTYMITVADVNRDKTMSSLEVQYVGFWINEDVAQAQIITLNNDPQHVDGWLILQWTENDGSRTETITYSVEEMEDGTLWRLMRKREISPESQQSGTSQVAEYLVPEQTSICRKGYWNDSGDGHVYSLVLEVAARADSSEASSNYEIYPRAAGPWWPQDDDGIYLGPSCS